MSSKPKTIKTPGPDHPITIERSRNRVVVKVADRVVADTRDALTLREAGYALVFYIPRKDVDMALLQRTEQSTYCPYKGDCAYFSIPLGGERSTNAVWTYEAPYAAGVHQQPLGLLPRSRRRHRRTTLRRLAAPASTREVQSCPRCSSFVTRPHLPNQSARDRLHAWDDASFINGHVLNVDAGKNH
jgi:uncharacterized protein (DUF427 family)